MLGKKQRKREMNKRIHEMADAAWEVTVMYMDGIVADLYAREDSQLDITEELLEQMRNSLEPGDGSGGRVDSNDLESDLFPIWERDLRPDMIITSYRIAKQIIELYSDRMQMEGEYTALYFAAPFPAKLVVIPSSLCHGEYFILDSERPDDTDSQAYRNNLVE